MSSFSIEVIDRGVHDSLNTLASQTSNMKPILQQIGEGIMERTKLRFSTSLGPDGRRWQANARSTIEAFIAKRRGFGKRGINKKGQALAMSKKPLIGESRDLSRQFYVYSDQLGVTVGNSMIYSAIHQFGGQAGRGKKTNIPARPFLPIMDSGRLYDRELALIIEQLDAFLADRLNFHSP